MYVWKAFNFSSGVTVHKQNLGFDVTVQYRFGAAGGKKLNIKLHKQFFFIKQRFTSAYAL